MSKIAEHPLKELALRLVALWRHHRVAHAIPIDLLSCRRLLVFRPEKIGDLVLSLPLVDVLKRGNPDLQVDALISEQSAPILVGDPRFAHVHLFRRSGASDVNKALKLHDNNYDIIIDLIGSDSYSGTIAVLLVSSAKTIKISVGKKRLAHYYDHNCDIFPDRHMKESTMQPLDLFGLTWDSSDLFAPPFRSPESLRSAGSFVKSLRLPAGRKPIGINISAGVRNRQWSKENVAALLKLMVEELPEERFVLIAGPKDYAVGKHLADDAGPSVTIIPKGLSLGTVCAIIGELRLLVGPDTSLPHIARSLRIPIVGLYLPFNEDFKRWGPLMQERGMLIARTNDSIDEITPDMVMAEISAVLAGSQ